MAAHGSSLILVFVLACLTSQSLLSSVAAQKAGQICPLTGKPPVKPTKAHPRCPAAKDLSCCDDCADVNNTVIALTYNLTAALLNSNIGNIASNPIIASFIPSDLNICSIFGGYSDCQRKLESLFCAGSCDPDAGTYVRSNTTGSFAMVCEGFATSLWDSCMDVSVVGVPISTFFTAQTFISTIFDQVVAALGVKNFKSVILPGTTGCYNGTSELPSTSLCCETFAGDTECPVNPIKVDLAQCPATPAPPPASTPSPPTPTPPTSKGSSPAGAAALTAALSWVLAAAVALAITL